MIDTDDGAAAAPRARVKDDSRGSAPVAAACSAELKPFQLALLEQAIARLADLYDPEVCLLSHPINSGFKPIRESLCYAGLLLLRNRAQAVSDSGLLRARKLVDAVLARQNRNMHGSSGGAFPLAWSKEKRSSVMDHDARQVLGSLLAVLARDFALELGRARVDEMHQAVQRATRGEDPKRLQATGQRQLKTWLEVEHGERLLGEELLVELTDLPRELLAGRRFGSTQRFSYELWASALWRRSTRLDLWGERLLQDLLTDVAGSLHPSLHQLLGDGLASWARSEGGAQWLDVWLTWLALGSNPLLPRDLDNPLDATLFAFPALSGLDAERLKYPEAQPRRQVERLLEDRRISAWFEPELHLEACAAPALRPGSEPLVAAFWRRAPGVARLTCHATGRHEAVCDGRSVKLREPGKCRISIGGLGRGATRLVEDGWEMPGLRFTCRGFEIGGAERTADGLSMTLRPLREQPLLVFSPQD